MKNIKLWPCLSTNDHNMSKNDTMVIITQCVTMCRQNRMMHIKELWLLSCEYWNLPFTHTHTHFVWHKNCNNQWYGWKCYTLIKLYVLQKQIEKLQKNICTYSHCSCDADISFHTMITNCAAQKQTWQSKEVHVQ
jgi:hypothetical protein